MVNKFSTKYFIAFFLTILLIFRLTIPLILKSYVLNVLNKIPEYRTEIKTIDVQLLLGKYIIQNPHLYKISKKIPVPFFTAESIILSVDWKELLHGALVAKMDVINPELNFVIDPQGVQDQLTIDDEWESAVTKLFPLNLNCVNINNGIITLQSFRGKPPFKLIIKNVYFNIQNMQAVQNDVNSRLFSKFYGTASMNKGKINISGHLNPFKNNPTFFIKSSLVGMNINQSNDFLQHFTKLRVSSGIFNLFLEFAAAKGQITGYAKPFVKNLKIFSPKEKLNPIEFLYKGLVVISSKIITNSKSKTIATKINIRGNIDSPKTNWLSIVGYIFRNAFIQALVPQIDNTVKMQDINYS